MLVLGFTDYESQGRQLAQELGATFSLVDVHHFPDGENRIRLPERMPEHVVLCRSLNQPNAKLIELLLAAETARELGAKQLTLVAPYLCYMRQDIAFHTGEAVSQRIIGRFLASLFDTVITVDAHLHRIDRLEQALPGITAVNLSATALMGEFISTRMQRPLLAGPDSESRQWVQAIAASAGLDFIVATKERLGDRSVRIKLPEGNYQGREVVLIDDMVSTGNTLIAVAEALREAGAGPVHCLVTHALFDEAVTQRLHEAGIQQIWSSDSIDHPSNTLPLAKLLATAVV